jgi:hypothetical protein
MLDKTLELRLSISPAPSFYSTVRLAALSLRRLGPPYDSARMLVSVGDCTDLDTIRAANAWSDDFPVEWRSVPHELFRDHSYLATHNDRYLPPPEADVIVMCDSDVCLVDRIDELVERVGQPGRRAIAGLQAHFAPFQLGGAGNEAEWRRIFASAGLGKPQLTRRYSGDPADLMGRVCAYFNYGFVAFSRAAFTAVAPQQASFSHLTRALMNDSFFLTQASLSLLIVAAGLEVEPLTFAYNCSNDDLPFSAAEEFRIHCVDEIRVIHYLRDDQLDRRGFLIDPDAYQTFLSAPNLNAVNRRLRDHIVALSRSDDMVFR